MNKVTYLFGAGASRGAVPIVNEIPSRLVNFKNALVNTNGLTDNLAKGRDLLIKEIEETLSAIVRIEQTDKGPIYHPLQASIDTYAKKLFIIDREKYERLKAV